MVWSKQTMDVVRVDLDQLKQRQRTTPRTKYASFEKNVTAKVVRVYDGDTVTLAFTKYDRRGAITTMARCRLLGFDAPELRGGSEKEKACAAYCRDRLAAYVGNRVVRVDFYGADKYGRPLVELRAHRWWSPGALRSLANRYGTVNKWAENTLPGCVPYTAKTKKVPFHERDVRGWSPGGGGVATPR